MNNIKSVLLLLIYSLVVVDIGLVSASIIQIFHIIFINALHRKCWYIYDESAIKRLLFIGNKL